MTIIAAADGSALGNPGPAGWSWYVDDDRWAAGGWPHGTNNQGELMAVIDLFESTAHETGEDLRVLCDSQYVINAVTTWMPGWKRKGWRKADGSPVLNLELLKRLDAAIAGRRYTFEWVKGHAGHELNEAADDRARAAATAYQNRSAVPTGPGWPGSTVAPAVATLAVPAPAAKPLAERAPELDIFEIQEPEPVSSAGSTIESVIALERRLLDPLVRADSRLVDTLLHARFEEIGSSAQVWGRRAVIEALAAEPGTDATLELRGAEQVGTDAVLLTYRSASAGERTLRSSLWVRVDGHWLLRFHQGTREA